tara:strand:- start:186 stop:515 length:330 start_codon:yes stop_codon:yes gene_type:complete
MITRLKISRSTTGILAQSYNNLKHHLTPNIVLRNALMYSINNGDKYDDNDIDTGGTEFQISTLLGSNAHIYQLLINQYYKKRLSDDDLKKILAFHIEQGMKDKDFKSIF